MNLEQEEQDLIFLEEIKSQKQVKEEKDVPTDLSDEYSRHAKKYLQCASSTTTRSFQPKFSMSEPFKNKEALFVSKAEEFSENALKFILSRNMLGINFIVRSELGREDLILGFSRFGDGVDNLLLLEEGIILNTDNGEFMIFTSDLNALMEECLEKVEYFDLDVVFSKPTTFLKQHDCFLECSDLLFPNKSEFLGNHDFSDRLMASGSRGIIKQTRQEK